MATLVGTQTDLTDFLRALLELEYDAIQAYTTAIDRLDDVALKIRLEEFRSDHQRHIREMSGLLEKRGIEAPAGPDAKAVLASGKVVIGDWMGDRGILRAMLTNENDTNAAYERGVKRSDLGADLAFLLERNLEDERRHHSWIAEELGVMGDVREAPASEEFLRARWG